ncbi:MAG: tetraacyldisaccharide 4'-kinase [Dokdonella sp.]|uniref:tetraacyldisaccharide 4'-kinase n=1 Tax=Dokdonella sp. TaxID=2291710 RepID=UPI003BB20201
MKQADIDRIWYGDEPVPLWMRLLVPVYRALGAAVRLSWQMGLRTPARLAVPVIVIGNISVGGTGKTPLVLALIEALHGRGWKPGVVSRGYGGSARSPTLLDDSPDPAIVGDEPSLIRRRTGVPVAVGRNRVAAARLLTGTGVDMILADDGLQNPSLARDIEICVIDGARRLGNGRLLPAGPLRESGARLARVDFIVCNGGQPQSGEVPMRLSGTSALSVNGVEPMRPLAQFAGQRVHAVAGIGNPGRFFDSLRRHGIEVIEHAFDDHHALSAADLDFRDGLPILMTEKDAVKCASFADSHHWQVPVSAELPDAFFDAVDQRLRTHRRP